MQDDVALQICEIGKRLYDRGYAAANDGNLSARIGDDRFLCTPTLHSKGFLKPEDLCVVDGDGNQVSGRKKRSSEILLHLQVYRQRPEIQAVVHCHPPHATAFAVTRQAIPQCVLPEVELFLGEVPITPYATPGSVEFAKSIQPFVNDCNVVLLANHGTVSFGNSVEQAYWFTDILDAYCRILILAKQIGPIQRFNEDECRGLLKTKQKWGFTDPRIYGPHAGQNICGHQSFRHTWETAGVTEAAFPQGEPDRHQLSDQDIDRIAQRVVAMMRSGTS